MRKINTRQFHRATRSTPREINRKIVLNLVREHQPISRADLARRMHVSRGLITQIVDELIATDVVFEGATANAPRGRKPKLLHVHARDRWCVAVDVRFGRTFAALSDLDGRQAALESFETPHDPDALVAALAARVKRLIDTHDVGECEGIGMVAGSCCERACRRSLADGCCPSPGPTTTASAWSAAAICPTSPLSTAPATACCASCSPERAWATSVKVPRSNSAAPSTVATRFGMSWFRAVSSTPMFDFASSAASSSD